jgi:hypothetical protein
MNRRGFVGTVALATAAKVVGAEQRPHDPEYWKLPARVSDEEFGRICDELRRESAWTALHLCNAHYVTASPHHDGMILDGAWTALSFPREGLLRHMQDWYHQVNTWRVPIEIRQWRQGVQAQLLDDWRFFEWGYGLYLGTEGALRKEPRAYRLALADARARQAGYRDAARQAQEYAASDVKMGKKYGPEQMACVKTEAQWMAHLLHEDP